MSFQDSLRKIADACDKFNIRPESIEVNHFPSGAIQFLVRLEVEHLIRMHKGKEVKVKVEEGGTFLLHVANPESEDIIYYSRITFPSVAEITKTGIAFNWLEKKEKRFGPKRGPDGKFIAIGG